MLISLLLLSKIAHSQVNDHFDDGDFSQNAVWLGDVNSFKINPVKQLQSSGLQVASQTISLSTANQQSLNAKWEFFVQLNFDPTATNFTRVYLTSDQQDLKGTLNGYFLQIGETGSVDGYHLYRQTGTSISKIIGGAPKIRPNANVLMAKVKVTRDESGQWTVYTDITGGSNYSLEGSTVDNTFKTSAFMGVYCKYATASRYNQYIFDDFEVNDLVPDVIPPTVKSVAVIDALHLDVTFSEPLENLSALLSSNYNLSSQGSPVSVEETSSDTYRLTFSAAFETQNYKLSVSNVTDKKGNIITADNSVDFFYIKPYIAKYGDIVINEVFANPGGTSTLPQKEFVELWNTTNQYILTKGWKYADQTSTFAFALDTIKPNQHVVLCAKADTTLFKAYGKTIGLSPWPSLNNDHDVLTLSSASGILIDKVAYYDTWYKDEVKKKSGFSLELIDPENVCTGIQNWMGSNDAAGGTPGKPNSVYHAQISTEIPKLINASVTDSLSVLVQFSKTVDSLSASKLINYSINNGIGKPVYVDVQSPLFNSAVLKFGQPLARGIENTLVIEGLTDCAGNLISNTANTAKLFIAKKIGVHDLLIAEILANPGLNGVDFVEIYNATDHVLDLKDLQLANVDSLGKPASIKKVSASNLLIQPGAYWVLSSNVDKVKVNYFSEYPDHFTQLSSMPVYNNDKGTVVLLNNHLIVDQFDYNAKMHNALLRDANGVSLERVSFVKGANEFGNFKSAAASVGFATPGYKNSQELNGEEAYVKLLSKTFSPDHDGFEDQLQLDYQLTENASLATINIFTDKGILVKRLLKNQTVGTKGSLFWDGLNENGQLSGVGIYVVAFDVFDLNGNTHRYKNTCMLAAKLN
ncbi:lamin tail domain-containing protein [Pedobacter punctiformis]|uniref:Lamin tail domain-containing protein n=1 Tax=Pedobacter punctiformis TaxID=3004097 RepID=A0ABT4LD10_9SPHI|nr:lamin tail domain-containing protein [Pedobacter sp. HCMS5-2]MCZ4245597.1 lamin tail domain-containing protein [Pedobacter sp. HCMS5-2]